MVSQMKAAGYLAEKLSNQMANVQTTAERNDALKTAANSRQADHLQDIADEDRVHEKFESTRENPRVMDQVHISPKAQALYRAHEAKLEQAPERVHARIQKTSEDTAPKPKEPTGALGNLDPEA